MTTAQKPNKKVADLEKKEMLKKMAKLFQIAPVKVKPENGGALITVEHKVGKLGGYHTLRGLMEKLGLEAQHAEFVQDMIKQIKNSDERKKVTDAHYVRQKSRANKMVSEYRRHLEIFYGNYPEPLLPAFQFVPISDNEYGLYLQGLVTSTNFDLVVGDPEDIYRWTETVFVKTKKWADLNHRAEAQAKALMKHPALNKDLRQRLHQISQGQIPQRLGFEENK
jgi:hypothetical protein